MCVSVCVCVCLCVYVCVFVHGLWVFVSVVDVCVRGCVMVVGEGGQVLGAPATLKKGAPNYLQEKGYIVGFSKQLVLK